MTGATAAPLVPRGLIFGVAIVLVGLVFLADSLAMLDVATGWAIWPVAVIVAGVAIRLQPGAANQVFGVVLIVAGIWLLFNAIGIWTYSFWKTWPLILMLLGACIWYQSWRLKHLDSGQVGAVALLSQVTNQSGPVVHGAELSALAGDGLLDFGDVVRGAAPAVVNVLAIAGRVRMAVPIGWNVDLRVLAVPGRVSDTRNKSMAVAADPQIDLIVRGTAMLGIVEIVSSTGAPRAARATV